MARNLIIEEDEDALADPKLYIANPAKARVAWDNMMDDFREMGPLLSKEDKVELLRFCRVAIADDYIDVNKIHSQFLLVERIKEAVLDNANQVRDEVTVRDLTAFANAVGNLTGLYLRNQEKFDHMKELQNMREAVIYAIEELPPVQQAKFFTKLDELNLASY